MHSRVDCDQVQHQGDDDEPVHVMFLELLDQAHVIMASHYKMAVSRKTVSGLVFSSLLILIICIEATSMAFLRKSALAPRGAGKWLVFGTLGYAVVAMVFREVLKFASMARANALWDAGSIVLVTLVGKFIYHETYSTRQWVGVAFAVAAVLCMLGPETVRTQV